MDQDLFENARWLIGAIARGLHATKIDAAERVLARLLDQKLGEAHFRSPIPSRLPVLQHLASTVAEAILVSADLAAAIAAVEDHLQWLQSPNYNDALLGHGFTENYGWCHIIGPKGFFTGDDFLLGLLMLGPGCHYRDHYHPAPELYWPLTTHSNWKQEDGGFSEKAAGDIIWHEPNVVHATRTEDRPLLAVWAWTNDTATTARLVEA